MKDKELEEICLNIYKKHKQALDLIFENRPDYGSIISNILNEYLESRTQNENDIIFIQNKVSTSKTIKRFTLASFNKIFPPIANAVGGWGDGSNYYWEVKNYYAAGRINIIFAMFNYENINNGLAAKLAGLADTKLNDGWQWKTFKSFSIDFADKNKLDEFMELDYDEMKKAIIPKIDKVMEKINAYEKEIIDLWNGATF